MVDETKQIVEGTFKSGQRHGFIRTICDQGQVSIELYRLGARQAILQFYGDFHETGRNDPFGLLANLKPSDFEKGEDYTPSPRLKAHPHNELDF